MSWFSFVGEGVIAMKGYVRLGKGVEKQRTKAYKRIKKLSFLSVLTYWMAPWIRLEHLYETVITIRPKIKGGEH